MNSIQKLTVLLLGTLVVLSFQLSATIYTVTDNSDTGPNTLRQAIINANTNAGKDTIHFNLGPSLSGRTIQIVSALNAITGPLVIDGTSDGETPFGASDAQIKLQNIGGANYNGFWIQADSCEIYGIYITGFRDASSFNGCGIYVQKTFATLTFSTIGAAGKGNLISNNYYGIMIQATRRITISDNMIGLDSMGATKDSNEVDGIYMQNCDTVNIINNLLSGNGGDGIQVGTVYNLVIQGNKIGTNISGTAAIGNSVDGIDLFIAEATIGGSGAGEGNLISGNGSVGLRMESMNVTTVYGNTIGPALNQIDSIGNGNSGIYLRQGDSTYIGGDRSAGEGNIISGNGEHGINLWGSTYTWIQGNLFGLNSSGDPLPNTYNGIYIQFTTAYNIIGGTGAFRNYISSNYRRGIYAEGDSTFIFNNYVGTDLNGAAARPNLWNGVEIGPFCYDCEVGSPTEGGNLLCSNGTVGVTNGFPTYIPQESGLTVWAYDNHTLVLSNRVGIYADGNNGANAVNGITCLYGTIIGGTNASEANVIGNNPLNGIYFTGSNASGSVVKGNYIGTDAGETLDWGNNGVGILVNTADNVIIDSNVIVNCGSHGIQSTNSTDGLIIRANYIGTNSSQASGFDNLGDGIQAIGDDIVIGSATARTNIIVNNGGDGIALNSNDGVILGNYIGTNSSESVDYGNGANGIDIAGDGVRVGDPSAPNIIVYNAGDGIYSSCTNALIINNYIGTTSSFSTTGANGDNGVELLGSDGINIGGNGLGNIIANHPSNGILATGTDNASILGNYIGTNALSSDLGNNGFGIRLIRSGIDGAANDTIGAITPGSGNTIAYNGNQGINITGVLGAPSQYNSIRGNSMFCNNLGGGIVLNGGANANEGVAAPSISITYNTSIAGGSGCNGCTIDLYQQDATCSNCEGETYIGSAITDGSGNWVYNPGTPLTISSGITATVTTTNNSTSAFASCQILTPVTLTDFYAKQKGNNAVISWTTESELNNNFFTLEKSTDGINYIEFAEVNGAGNSVVTLHYEFIDPLSISGNHYYRLSQTDYDGTTEVIGNAVLYSMLEGYQILQNGNEIIIQTENITSSLLSVFSPSAGLVEQINLRFSSQKEQEEGSQTIDLNHLTTGIYYLHITDRNSTLTHPFIKH